LSASPELALWPERIGVAPGDRVLLTADVTRVAWLFRRSGVNAVPSMLLDAFLARVGPEGTIVVPTFNYDLRSGEAYDHQRSPTITGALGQAALDHPAFKRTGNPLHSFAVAGRLQQEFLSAESGSSFGENTPFALLRGEGFTLVGIDMHLNYAMSYFHHVEELERVSYRRWQDRKVRYTDAQGVASQRTFKVYAKRWGYENELSRLIPQLQGSGAMGSGHLENVSFLRVDLRKAHEVITMDIRKNGARSIVRFTWKNWMRDFYHAALPSDRPSRSQQLLTEVHARPQ
jgi:aminoglycoside 3-N-acetyltransferase